MESSPSPPHLLLDVDLTIVSAKHLKNVNWRRGALAPYAVASCFDDPNCRLPTTVDSSGGTKPVWNHRFALSISVCRPFPISFLTFDIFHSDDDIQPSSSSISVAFPLVVGSARLPLDDALSDSPRLLTLELRRPSGRPQGRLKIKIAVRKRPFSATGGYPPPAPAPVQPRGFLPLPGQLRMPVGYSAPHPIDLAPPSPNFFSDRHSRAKPLAHSLPLSPPLMPNHYCDRAGYDSGPSAPLYSSPSASSSVNGENGVKRGKRGKLLLGTGPPLGTVAGACGGIVMEEGMKNEEKKGGERDAKNPAGMGRWPEHYGGY
ncbi:SRC2-like protein [Nymphaea thermarum]|nr:SRC2-like protein [Nymphaea thermarum]